MIKCWRCGVYKRKLIIETLREYTAAWILNAMVILKVVVRRRFAHSLRESFYFIGIK